MTGIGDYLPVLRSRASRLRRFLNRTDEDGIAVRVSMWLVGASVVFTIINILGYVFNVR